MKRWRYGIAMLDFKQLDREFETERIDVERSLDVWGGVGFELVNLVPQPSGKFLAVFKKPADD